MRRLLSILACLLAPAVLWPAASSARPIVYVVVIDGLDGDAVDSGHAPFIKSMLNGVNARGAYYPHSRSVIPAQTNPNHVAMMTGAYPGSSGIPGNAFALYRPLAGDESCVPAGPLDFSSLPSQTTGESPSCPLAETVFESFNRQADHNRPATAVVMGKPKLGRIFDVGYRGRRAADYLWAPCESGPEDDAYCANVELNPITGYALSDSTVMNEVIDTMGGVPFGKGFRRPDFTFANLPQVDSAGHAFGRGPLYNTAIAFADAEIQRLVTALKSRGEWRRSVVILVSDHSMDSTPQKVSLTDEFAEAGIPESEFLAIGSGGFDSVFLGDRRARRSGRGALLRRMRDAALAHPGVAEAWYRQPNPVDGGRRFTVRRNRPGWGKPGIRTGDLLATTHPGSVFSDAPLVSNLLPGEHGSPSTADNFLGVIGGWRRIRQTVVTGPGVRSKVRNTDLASTISGLFGLRPPRDNDGIPLRAAFKRGTLSP